MKTKNVIVTSAGWQDVETLGSLTFENNSTYSVSIIGNSRCEVCLSDTTPANTLKGHPLKADDSFTFTYSGYGLWVKKSGFDNTSITVVVS